MPTLPRTVPVSSGDVSNAITWSIKFPFLQDIQNREQHEPNTRHKVPVELGVFSPSRLPKGDGQDRQPADNVQPVTGHQRIKESAIRTGLKRQAARIKTVEFEALQQQKKGPHQKRRLEPVPPR